MGTLTVESYVAGIVDLLEEAGVPPGEIKEERTEQLLTHAYLKGRTFEEAALAACRRHRIEFD